jgi:sulfur carrier protein ThiS adenylyltransferase
MSSTNRDIRQRDLIPPDRLAECHAVVIGVGAIGRQVALQLVAVGMPRMTYDPDTVCIENVAPQGFWESDIDRAKVEADADLARRQLPPAMASVPTSIVASISRSMWTCSFRHWRSSG